jgi:hypothetical protein
MIFIFPMAAYEYTRFINCCRCAILCFVSSRAVDMSFSEIMQAATPTVSRFNLLLIGFLLLLFAWQPDIAIETMRFAIAGMVEVMPIVIPGIVLAAWISASGASS